MEKSMTYIRPISGRAAVECSDGKTLAVEKRPGYPTVVTGSIIDRLRAYEEVGTPEYFKKLAKKDTFERARKLAMNSIFGGYGTMLKIGEEDQMKAIADLDISQMYPKSMLTPEYVRYIEHDVEVTKAIFEKVNLNRKKSAIPEIDHVIFNNPATIIFWKDDTKTVVKVNPGECYDPEKGLVMAMLKKALGNKGNYYNTIFKHLQGVDIPVLCYARDYFELDAKASFAYDTLIKAFDNKKATKADLLVAIEEALGFLGEVKEGLS